jgi:predicted alpha/beta-hydrolase family hydrolase
MSGPEELRFVATPEAGEVSALLQRPANARWLLVFGHGSSAGMRHAFVATVSELLAGKGIATFRYQFPYMEQGRKLPSPQPVLTATVRAAVTAAAAAAPDLPLLAGGKSLGGRMTSLAAASDPLPGVHGIVFFGFPLHPAGRPGDERAAHLAEVTVPMLFLQGTRDKLADLGLLRPLLGPGMTLHVEEGADHGFSVLKRSGRTHEEVLAGLVQAVDDWTRDLPPASP